MPRAADDLTACPECNAPLAGVDRLAHSRSHWPDTIPNYPTTLKARRYQAALEGRTPPEE